MTGFLWTMLALQLVATLAKAIYLGRNRYPRVVTYSPGEDVFAFLLEIGFVLWIAWLLFVA